MVNVNVLVEWESNWVSAGCIRVAIGDTPLCVFVLSLFPVFLNEPLDCHWFMLFLLKKLQETVHEWNTCMHACILNHFALRACTTGVRFAKEGWTLELTGCFTVRIMHFEYIVPFFHTDRNFFIRSVLILNVVTSFTKFRLKGLDYKISRELIASAAYALLMLLISEVNWQTPMLSLTDCMWPKIIYAVLSKKL